MEVVNFAKVTYELFQMTPELRGRVIVELFSFE
jgi:hypothetical protein